MIICMMTSDNVSRWGLMKYARISCDSKGKKPKVYENCNGKLCLSLTNTHHLLITCEEEILENHSLWNSNTWMSGLQKGDSMLLLSKAQGECRKFRVKFSPEDDFSGVQQCQNCVSRLSTYFHIQNTSISPSEESDTQTTGSSGKREEEAISGTTSVGKLAQVLSGAVVASLPIAYQSTNIPTEQLGTLTRLCLSDSNFPAFVGQVEEEMNKIIKGTAYEGPN